MDSIYEEPSESKYKDYAVALGFNVIFCFITHPFEFAEFLLEVGHFPIPGYPKRRFGIRNTFKYVSYVRQKEGFTGCYRGILSNIRVKVTTQLVNISTASGTQDIDDDIESVTGFGKLLLRELAEKSLAVLVSQPFMVISWRVMGQFIGHETMYSGFFGSVGEIYTRGGLSGFFVGFTPRCLSEVLAHCMFRTITYLLYSFFISDPLYKAVIDPSVEYICIMLTYPLYVAAVCYGVNDCGLACGLPPNMPKFHGWVDAVRFLSESGRLYSRAPKLKKKQS